MKDDELHLKKMSLKNEKDLFYSHKKPFNRYLSHSSAIINNSNQRLDHISFDERERRNTYTLPRQPRSNLSSSKDRRLTVSSINYPPSTNQQTTVPTRDTDSSSTQDSGYSESTPFFLVQQTTPDSEKPLSHSVLNVSKVCLKSIEISHL